MDTRPAALAVACGGDQRYPRLLAAKLGQGVYVDTTGFLEWDLVEIGDRVALDADRVLQTHLLDGTPGVALAVAARCDSLLTVEWRLRAGGAA